MGKVGKAQGGNSIMAMSFSAMNTKQLLPKMVKVYQYQLEFEGGQRFGPSWMHRKEAQKYLIQQVRQFPEYKNRLNIVRYWILERKSKFNYKGIKPEFVKEGG